MSGNASFNAVTSDLTGGADTNSAFTLTLGSQSTGTGDFSAGGTWSSVAIGAYVSSGSVVIADNAGYGTFSGNVISDTYSGVSAANARSVIYQGIFTRPGFLPTPALVTVQYNETGGAYAGGVTLAMDPSGAVPEPASLAIFGIGAAGFAARRFRRK